LLSLSLLERKRVVILNAISSATVDNLASVFDQRLHFFYYLVLDISTSKHLVLLTFAIALSFGISLPQGLGVLLLYGSSNSTPGYKTALALACDKLLIRHRLVSSDFKRKYNFKVIVTTPQKYFRIIEVFGSNVS
jgi:hypothetical protein